MVCQQNGNPQILGRNIKCSVAVDNGRSKEFDEKRDYSDKSKCFECGVSLLLGEYNYRNLAI